MKLIKILNTLNTWSTFLSDISNLVSIISILMTIALYALGKLIYTYRLKKFSVTMRPRLLSEEEFYNACNQYIKTRLKSETGKRYVFKQFEKKILIRGKKQYHIVLGETGTGKSTFLINLYYRYNCKFFRRGYRAEYIPLRSKNALQEIKKIEDPRKTILLLDAFDEANDANNGVDQFIEKIEMKTSNFAKVIISSRNNFFDKEKDIPSIVQHVDRNLSLSEEKYNRYYIQPFTNRDVYIYLIKKYKLFLNKYIKAIKVLKYCDDIICRPLVISYIDLLIDSDNSYKSITDVYYKIIDNWIKREAYYIAKQDKKHTQEEIETKLFSFISEVAIFMYENYPEKLEYSIKITELKKIKNADFLEKIEGKRNRSLFNRVNEQLIFTHKSILEYVLAENFDKIKFRYEKNLNSLYKFLKDIIGENYNAKYAPLFYLNFGDTSLKIMDDNKKINELTCYIIYYSQDREFVEAMVWWYKKAIELPVLIKDKLYIRTSIAFKVQDRYIAQISPQNDLWEIIEKIMKNIKMGVANRTLVEIKVITILYECPEGLFESYYYLQKIVKNKRKVKSPSYAGANRVVENGKDS